jgi:hypothetical protein
MNNKQRARWIADVTSDLQRVAKHTREHPEDVFIQKAIESLRQAREAALKDSNTDH